MVLEGRMRGRMRTLPILLFRMSKGVYLFSITLMVMVGCSVASDNSGRWGDVYGAVEYPPGFEIADDDSFGEYEGNPFRYQSHAIRRKSDDDNDNDNNIGTSLLGPRFYLHFDSFEYDFHPGGDDQSRRSGFMKDASQVLVAGDQGGQNPDRMTIDVYLSGAQGNGQIYSDMTFSFIFLMQPETVSSMSRSNGGSTYAGSTWALEEATVSTYSANEGISFRSENHILNGTTPPSGDIGECYQSELFAMSKQSTYDNRFDKIRIVNPTLAVFLPWEEANEQASFRDCVRDDVPLPLSIFINSDDQENNLNDVWWWKWQLASEDDSEVILSPGNEIYRCQILKENHVSSVSFTTSDADSKLAASSRSFSASSVNEKLCFIVPGTTEQTYGLTILNDGSSSSGTQQGNNQRYVISHESPPTEGGDAHAASITSFEWNNEELTTGIHYCVEGNTTIFFNEFVNETQVVVVANLWTWPEAKCVTEILRDNKALDGNAVAKDSGMETNIEEKDSNATSSTSPDYNIDVTVDNIAVDEEEENDSSSTVSSTTGNAKTIYGVIATTAPLIGIILFFVFF